jgi:hypothetical protein
MDYHKSKCKNKECNNIIIKKYIADDDRYCSAKCSGYCIGKLNKGKLKGHKYSKEEYPTRGMRGKNHTIKTKRKLDGNQPCIHHINGNHLDNRPNNLMVIIRSDHCKLHHLQGDIHKRKILK